MRIGLIGYGKMGKAIDQLAQSQGIEIAFRVDHSGFDPDVLDGCDVAIEFTQPDAAPHNIEVCCEKHVPIVCGTTGWYADLDRIRGTVDKCNGTLVYGSNLSIGVALFRRIVEKAAEEFRDHPSYEAWAYEMHHSAKLDAPSGTLLRLVDDMRAAGYSAQIDVSSSRAGKVPGTHTIGFDSAADTITLTHTARNRDGFAAGALHAAQWIIGKTGVYEFAETL
ncbi:MAG: dihydrodipicolinate reductase C-terminal domain-containing protein [Fimbriimonadaceae bacterium]